MSRARRGASLAAITIALAVAGCTTRIPMPPDDATPRQVIDVYLRALAATDCETARALGSDHLCGIVTGATVTEELPPVDETMRYLTTIVVSGGDGSLPDGPNPWTYELSRGSGGQWRIVNEGMG